MPILEQLGMQAATGAVGGLMGLGLGGMQDRRQYKQQEKMQKLQIQGQKELTDYNAMKQLQMWKDTSYGAQKEQMKLAGINPALMYGMGGGGGQSSNVNSGSVSGGGGPSTGGEMQGMMGMAMQMALLKAQKDNIEQDTDTKKAQELETLEKANLKSLEVALEGALQMYSETGEHMPDITGTVRFKERAQQLKKITVETVFTGNEDDRQKAMNSAKLGEIAAEIDLMKKKGMSEVQILENLKKSGELMQMELDWNKIGLTKDTLKQVLLGLLKGLVK